MRVPNFIATYRVNILWNTTILTSFWSERGKPSLNQKRLHSTVYLEEVYTSNETWVFVAFLQLARRRRSRLRRDSLHFLSGADFPVSLWPSKGVRSNEQVPLCAACVGVCPLTVSSILLSHKPFAVEREKHRKREEEEEPGRKSVDRVKGVSLRKCAHNT